MFSAIADFYRLMRAGFILGRHDALLPREFMPYYPVFLRPLSSLSRLGAKHVKLRPGQRMARGLSKLGPAYVKLGQFLATRPDIIGFTLADDLSTLQDKMPPFDDALARKELERNLGKPVDMLFASFSAPIAAASIAQAHQATLKDGKKVAVKILRPKIERIAGNEFRAFLRLAKLTEAIFPLVRRMEPVKLIETLKASAAIELDLRLEAGACAEMGEKLGNSPNVRVPDVMWDLTAKRVLTTQWIDGVSISDLDALEKAGHDRKALAKRVVETFLIQALHNGFFHADMHQGNLIVQTNGDLTLIDFGIVGRLDEPTRHSFAEIIFGFAQQDYQRTAKAHYDIGYITDEYPQELFAQALRSVGEPLYGRNANMVDMSKVLQQLFDVTEMFDMHLRPELVLLQRTMVTVEGVARLLDPEIDMWSTATPIVKSYIEREIGVKAQAKRLGDTARDLAQIAPRVPKLVDALIKLSENFDAQSTAHKPAQDHWRQITRALVFVGGAIIALALAIALR